MSEIKKIFTDKFIESINPQKAIVTYVDASNKHLKLYVRPSGAKTYYFRARVEGKEVKRKLGSVDSISLVLARILATNCFQEQTKTLEIPALENTLQPQRYLTVDQVFELYKVNELDHRSTIAGRTHGLEVAYNLHAKPEIGSCYVSDINKKFARDFFKKMQAKGYSVHNKLVSVLKSAFNYVIDYEDELNILVNPFDRIKKMTGVSRNRYLTHSEASRLLKALNEVANQDVADIYRLALFTGARLSNVKQMLWTDINMSSGVWLIPSGQTKTKQHYEIPLHDLVLNILAKRRISAQQSEFVFPSKNKSKYGYITGGDPIWKEAITSAGLFHENPNIRPRPHDLRRTFATWQLQSGADISIVSKALCHTSLKNTLIYAHTKVDQVRDSINGAFGFLNNEC